MKFASVTVESSNLPEESTEILRALIVSRISERTVLSDRGAALHIRLELRPEWAGEHAEVYVNADSVKICGSRLRSLTGAAGMFLRTIRYEGSAFEADGQTLIFAPARPIRVAYFARHFHNWYFMAQPCELERYIEDLALQGINMVDTQMISRINFDDDFDTNPEALAFIDTFQHIADAVKRMDLLLCTTFGGNQSFRNAPKEFYSVPNSDCKRGNNGIILCPEKTGALDYILANERKLMKLMQRFPLDYLVTWPFDEGGCECEKCRPWGGRGYLKLIEKSKDVAREFFPNIKFIVSTWLFHDDDWVLFYQYLESHTWIDVVLADSHNDFPRYPLEHPLPHHTPLITFPEISMWQRSPWGGFGATPLPAHFERLFRQVQGHASGYFYYSEGISEDINKAIISAFYNTPQTTAEETLRQYCNYEFPGADPDDFVELCRLLESDHALNFGMSDFLKNPDADLRERYISIAQKADTLARKIESAILPRMRNCWRWRLFRCRTIIDRECFESGRLHTPNADAAYAELIEMYHAEKHAGDYHDPMHGCVRPQLD